MARLASPLVLASASPRRREILTSLGLPFHVIVSEVVEERAAEENAIAYTQRLAVAKASDVAAKAGDKEVFVLGADTVVICDDAVLEKPKDDDEGIQMLLRLSGRAHEVATAFAIVHATRGVLVSLHVVSEVVFRTITREEAVRYVATGEGRDKAGGYAVQGLASGFVEAIRGSYSNVVGLPARDVVDALQRCGALVEWP